MVFWKIYILVDIFHKMILWKKYLSEIPNSFVVVQLAGYPFEG